MLWLPRAQAASSGKARLLSNEREPPSPDGDTILEEVPDHALASVVAFRRSVRRVPGANSPEGVGRCRLRHIAMNNRR